MAGFTERTHGLLHSAAAVVRNGSVLGVNRKLFPRESAFSAGAELATYDLSGKRFGITICNDLNYVEPARLLALDGARILACPLNNDLPSAVTNRWRTRTRSNLIARAVENDCWVIAADVCGEEDGRLGGAATCIVAPDGCLLQAAATAGPELVLADISISTNSLLGRWQASVNPPVWRRWVASQAGTPAP